MSSILGQGTRIPHAIKYDQNIEQQSKKLRIKLPYNPAILFLGIYPYKTTIQKDICASMLTAALFTIAKTWKQTKCPMTDKWIKKMWYLHRQYYSAIKKNEINAICSNMDGPRDFILSEVRKRKANTILYHLYVESKIWHKWTYLWIRNRHREQTCGCQRGVGVRERKIGSLWLADASGYI